MGYAPSYTQGRLSVDQDAAIRWECEHGKRAQGTGRSLYGRKQITPETLDVLAALVMDASVLDCDDFEDWASDLGYDTDSRTAEAIYRECLAIALKLRNGIGDGNLEALRELFADY
jgi:hypothetical protein